MGMMERSTASEVSVPGRRKKFEPGTAAALGQCAAALCAVEHAQLRRRSDAIITRERGGFVQAGPGVVGTLWPEGLVGLGSNPS